MISQGNVIHVDTQLSIDRSIEIDIVQRYLRSRAETEIGSEKKEISKAVSVKEKERPG